MIPPRLVADRAVTEAVLLEAAQVMPDDPRLIHVDQGLCRSMMEAIAEAWFVAWPDGAFGFAILWPEDQIADLLIAAYVAARESLEMLALHCFQVDESAPRH